MATFIRNDTYTSENGRVWRTRVMRCTCGSEVYCSSSWANSCEGCDREYNGSGQELAPRSHWGEETGENFW
jgi:hypothetical protein